MDTQAKKTVLNRKLIIIELGEQDDTLDLPDDPEVPLLPPPVPQSPLPAPAPHPPRSHDTY
jgi:hypothetical protein